MGIVLNEFSRKSVLTLLTVLTLFAPVHSHAQAGTFAAIFGNDSILTPIDGNWRKGAPDLFMGFRANAPHYWNWLHQNQGAPVLAPQGVVVGDPHIQNFGDVPLKQGGRKYTLIDVDDSGANASLAGDFLRYFIGNRISPFKVDSKDLFNAYVDGVNGKKMDKPSYLKKIESNSNYDFDVRNNKKISKLTNGDSFSDTAELTPISQTSNEIQSLYAKASAAIQGPLADMTVLDTGYRTKTSGGSQGLPRFWFLLEDSHKQRHIYELKMETDPATSLFAKQPDSLTRFQEVENIYRPTEEVLGPFEFIQAGEFTFLLREKLYSYVDLDPAKMTSDSDIKDAKEMSLYIANKMGIAHGQQSAGPALQELLSHDQALDQLKALAEEYINLISGLN